MEKSKEKTNRRFETWIYKMCEEWNKPQIRITISSIQFQIEPHKITIKNRAKKKQNFSLSQFSILYILDQFKIGKSIQNVISWNIY